MDTGGRHIGRRIAYWRDRRGYTQADLARLMGRSRRWVQDLEGGQRQADPRLSVLERAADVLRIPLERLLTDHTPPPDRAAVPPGETLAVLEVLDRHDVSTGLVEVPATPPSLADLHRGLTYCCEAFQACHYTTLDRQLPALILGAHRAVTAAPADRVCATQAMLSRVYQLATSFLHKYGDATIAQAAIAADRALAAAERSADPVAIGAASRRVAKSMLHQGRPESAAAFACAAAGRLAGELVTRGPLGLSTLGMLYLGAAVAASGRQRSADAVRQASDLVDEAADVAGRQGGDRNEDWTMFGPTNVELHRVDVLVRFEDGWSALEAADGLTAGAVESLTKERRAQHLIAMARASLLTRRWDDAVRFVVEAEELAPEEVRRRSFALALVEDLVGVMPIPPWELRALALRCGLRA
ncbi:helix-turn-helix transcriptional regulator [Streptomyces capparidis]